MFSETQKVEGENNGEVVLNHYACQILEISHVALLKEMGNIRFQDIIGILDGEEYDIGFFGMRKYYIR